MNFLRYLASVKKEKFLAAVYDLPKGMAPGGIAGEMAVHALDAAVTAGVEPGLIAGLHDVAAAAKLRGAALGIKLERAEGQKSYYHHNSRQQH